MLEGWKKYKLDDIAEVLNSKRVPVNSRERLKVKGTIPYYGASGIVDFVNGFIFDGEHVLISEDGENLRSRKTPIAFKANGKFWVNNHAHILKGKQDFLNDWIVYYIANLDINPYLTGAVQPKLNKQSLLSIPIIMPAYKEVELIASVLSALDDKIELNLQMNKTLEDMAMALYKHCFVDFGPFQNGEFVESELGMIPKGWEVKRLEDILEIKYGKDHKKLTAGNIPVYGSGGIMRYVDQFLYDHDSILIPRKGTLSNLFYLTTPFWSVDTMFYSKIKIKHFGKYVFYFLKSIDLASMDVGSAIPSLTTELLKRITTLAPPILEIVKFDETVTRYFKTMESNTIENQTLTKLRDTLLPKLISGEVRVKDIEQTVAQVL